MVMSVIIAMGGFVILYKTVNKHLLPEQISIESHFYCYIVRNPSPEVKRRNQHKQHKHKHKSRRDKGGTNKRRKGSHHHDVLDSKRKHSHGGDVEVTRREEKDEGPSIQQLRAERINREAAERLKTNRLLSGQNLNEEDSKVSEEMTDRPGRYNSQFHPELVRNKRKSFHFNNIWWKVVKLSLLGHCLWQHANIF